MVPPALQRHQQAPGRGDSILPALALQLPPDGLRLGGTAEFQERLAQLESQATFQGAPRPQEQAPVERVDGGLGQSFAHPGITLLPSQDIRAAGPEQRSRTQLLVQGGA